jgi:large subunit ribosomal protein L4
MAGDELRREDLEPSVFGIEPNGAVMHQAFVRQMANVRRGSHRTQTRSEVSRTKTKWYRQKGTGRARHGARSAPTFVGGGVSHGPQPRSYRKSMPRQMRRLALRSALATKAAEESIVLIDELAMDAPKTSTMDYLVDAVCDGQTTLVVLSGPNEPIERSIRNLSHVRYLRAGYLNVRDLLGYDRIMMDLAAMESIVAHLGSDEAGSGSAAEVEETADASD